jgi:hypothetical protein
MEPHPPALPWEKESPWEKAFEKEWEKAWQRESAADAAWPILPLKAQHSASVRE